MDHLKKIVFEDIRSRLLERSVDKPAPTSETEYDDRNVRADVIRRSIQDGTVGYQEANERIEGYHRDGVKGLPFDIHRENCGSGVAVATDY